MTLQSPDFLEYNEWLTTYYECDEKCLEFYVSSLEMESMLDIGDD